MKTRELVGTSPEVIEQMIALAQTNNGLLKAEDVLEAAKNEDSPVHNKFEWDDGEAAEKYRLIQARYMISVSIRYIPRDGKVVPMKVFVSLSSDRHSQKVDGGMPRGIGYRLFDDVMADPDLKNQMLMDSLQQMTYFQEKYKSLQELQEVFMAIEKTKGKVQGQIKSPKA